MLDWYLETVVTSGRLPIFLALLAFVLTFVTVRIITRLIRGGRGPFKNVSAGGIHVHHVVPGVICVLVGGLFGFAASFQGPWRSIGAIVFGCGAALVLDEFAMILHLEDVYWQQEGRLSADAVLIAVAVMAVTLVIAAPENPPGPPETDPYVAWLVPLFFIVLWVVPVAVTILKGKIIVGVCSMVFIPVAWVSAARLAKPRSPWAQVRYQPTKLIRSQQRFARVDARWRPVRDWIDRHIFGFGEHSPDESPPS